MRGAVSSLAAWMMLAALLMSCTVAERPDSTTGREALKTPVVHEDAVWIRKALSGAIARMMDEQDITGLSLALVRNREALWVEGFGYADRRLGVPATGDTVFRAGSLAKPITAIAVMQLEERGLLDIDQPLSSYLPQFSVRSRFDTVAAPITVRSVLCHHSGLPTDLHKGMWSEASFTEVASQLSEEYAAFPSNLVFSYSNVGYSLLGHLIQVVTQTPYTDYMQRHLFRPMGMRHTAMGPSPELEPLTSKGYDHGHEAELLPIRDLPAYGLYTSAGDLARLMTTLLSKGRTPSGEILMPETLEEMYEPQNTGIPLDLGVLTGLGWFLDADPGLGDTYDVRHGGTTLLFSSELILVPSMGLGAAVLANSRDSRNLVSLLAKEVLRLAGADLDYGQPAATASEADVGPAAPDPAESSLGGDYATDLGLISIRRRDAKVCACMLDKTFDLIPYPNGWYGVRTASVDSLPPTYRRTLDDLRFQTRIIAGKEVMVANWGDHAVLLGEKVPPAPVPEAWLNRVGRYEILNPDKGFPLDQARIQLQNGQLCMSYKMPRLSASTIRLPLQAISDTEAIILGLGRGRGETVRAVSIEGGEGLRYSGFLGRRLPDAP